MSDSNTDSSPNLIPESTTDSGGESVRELGSRSFGDRGGSARLSASQIQLQTCDPRAAIGSVICKDYEIREIIGEGGMAVVYKVRKISTGQIIAGKTLRFVEKALTERFLREIEIHTRLMHKNIVAPVEFAMTATGQAFFFMELLSGTSLEDVFARYGRIRRAIDIADILIQICQALSYAHSKGIVHRDIKPGNVIVNMSKEGVSVKVVDFGLAKLYEDLQRITKTGQVLGSPVYMSPEQCMGLTLDPRSDVYSLGILAYEMITGVLPYDGSSPVALMEQHCNPDKMPVPVQSKRVEMEGAKQANMIIFRALQSEPDSRFQSADQMRQAWLAWRALICGDSDNGYFARPEFSTYAVADSQVFA
ncbi:MAG: serine/threonine protein kinase, partial [Candidatus Obscuribacterales bacterium]|nr:serine/threonine protein kinase [Candidatus Obscuribacterales bacterium]